MNFDKLSKKYNIKADNIRKVVMVEGSGFGYDKKTGRILIQFEPSWFKRLFLKWKNNIGVWATNKVENQEKEWIAFNNAYSKNPTSAMMATSWGAMQVMGFHYKKLGFNSVGYMVDFAKESFENQVELGLKFILTNKKMYVAIQLGDWETFAYYYNGAQYKKFNYAERLRKA